MNSTRTARVLIFINLAMSLTFVAWSIGLYTQRLPWQTYTTSDGDKVTGRIEELTAQVKMLVEAREKADNRWTAATREVVRLEQQIPARRAFYAEQLNAANKGVNLAGAPVTPPVQQLVFRDGVLDTAKAARPAYQIDGKPALSFAGFKAAIEKQLEEIRDTKMRINKVVADTTAVTDQINGTKPLDQAITNVEKGLRGQLHDAQALAANAILEQQFLQTPVTNFRVEIDVLRRRQATLEARLKELTQSAKGF